MVLGTSKINDWFENTVSIVYFILPIHFQWDWESKEILNVCLLWNITLISFFISFICFDNFPQTKPLLSDSPPSSQLIWRQFFRSTASQSTLDNSWMYSYICVCGSLCICLYQQRLFIYLFIFLPKILFIFKWIPDRMNKI